MDPPKPKRPIHKRLVRGFVKGLIYGVPTIFVLELISNNTPWLTWWLPVLKPLRKEKVIAKDFFKSQNENLFKDIVNSENLDPLEFEKPIGEFDDLYDFVTRKLKPRPLKISEKALLVPADATLMSLEKVHKNFIMTVKGNEYSLGELLKGEKGFFTNADLENLKFDASNDLYSAIFYIPNFNYKRIHSPSNFHINRYSYIKGKRIIYGNVVKNFRSGFSPLGKMYLTLVGCWKTGSITINNNHEFEDYKDQAVKGKPMIFVPESGHSVFEQGQEVGYFNFGSAVVLVFEVPKNFQFQIREGDKVKYGQTFGSVIEKE